MTSNCGRCRPVTLHRLISRTEAIKMKLKNHALDGLQHSNLHEDASISFIESSEGLERATYFASFAGEGTEVESSCWFAANFTLLIHFSSVNCRRSAKLKKINSIKFWKMSAVVMATETCKQPWSPWQLKQNICQFFKNKILRLQWHKFHGQQICKKKNSNYANLFIGSAHFA